MRSRARLLYWVCVSGAFAWGWYCAVHPLKIVVKLAGVAIWYMRDNPPSIFCPLFSPYVPDYVALSLGPMLVLFFAGIVWWRWSPA
jgi:hypothetical protein